MSRPAGSQRLLNDFLAHGWYVSVVDQLDTYGMYQLRAMRRGEAREAYANTIVTVNWTAGRLARINVCETVACEPLCGVPHRWLDIAPRDAGYVRRAPKDWTLADVRKILAAR